MNKQKKIIIASACLSFLMGGFALAQDASTSSQAQTSVQVGGVRSNLVELRQKAQEKISAAKALVAQHISKIKDAAKQQAATKITNRFNHVNEVWTDHFTDVLDRLSNITEKIQSRANKAVANGQDISSVTSAIADATAKIQAARTAVATQAQKTYTVDASAVTATQSNQGSLVAQLRSQFKTLRDQLFSDLSGLRDGPVRDVRASVQNAFNALNAIPNVDVESESTANTNVNNQ